VVEVVRDLPLVLPPPVAARPRPRARPDPAASPPAEPAPPTSSQRRVPRIVGTYGDATRALDEILGPDDGPRDFAIAPPDEVAAASGYRMGGGSHREERPRIAVRDAPEGPGTGPGAAVEVEVPRPVVAPQPPPDLGDRDVILRVVRASGGSWETCVSQALKRNPRLEGRVSVGWSVRDGRVVAPRVVDDTSDDPELASCFVRNVRAMRFPAGFSAEVAEFPWVVSGG
jgi:hypothetical protein